MNLRTAYGTWVEGMRAVATAWNNAFSGARMVLGIDTTDDLIVDSTKGLVLKSANGHYWRIAVDNAGALSTTDLGTTKP